MSASLPLQVKEEGVARDYLISKIVCWFCCPHFSHEWEPQSSLSSFPINSGVKLTILWRLREAAVGKVLAILARGPEFIQSEVGVWNPGAVEAKTEVGFYTSPI